MSTVSGSYNPVPKPPAPSAAPAAPMTRMYTGTRSGPGHFNGSPPGSIYSTGTTEGRSGLSHFQPSGGTTYQTPGTSVAGGPPGSPTAAPEYVAPYGSQSGPGILENWFNQRANGTDPGYEYAMKRGMNDIDSRMAAGGSYNSGARGQNLSDFAANMGAQREGQLDTLAAGASGEHLGRLGLMYQQGLGLAGGESGLASAYDLGAAGNMAAANQAQQQMFLNKAGVDQKASQGLISNLINAYAAYKAGG